MIAIFPGTALGNQQRFAIRLCEPTPHYLDNEITVLVTATGTAACPAQSSQPEWYSAPRRWDEQRDNVLNAAGVDIPHDSHDHPMLLGLPAKVSLALNVAGASYGDIDAVGGCLRAAACYEHHSMVVAKLDEVDSIKDMTVVQFTLRGTLTLHQTQHLTQVVLA